LHVSAPDKASAPDDVSAPISDEYGAVKVVVGIFNLAIVFCFLYDSKQTRMEEISRISARFSDLGFRPFHQALSKVIIALSGFPMSSVRRKSSSKLIGKSSSSKKEMLSARDRIIIGMSIIWPIALAIPT
jgi:hypothetical protein